MGEGKEINLESKCTRLKLQRQCIKYLGPVSTINASSMKFMRNVAYETKSCDIFQREREAYEVVVKDGKFIYKLSSVLLHTSEVPKDSKWIFVLSTSKNLYVGQVNILILPYYTKRLNFAVFFRSLMYHLFATAEEKRHISAF